ncbi:MAG TPA: GIDE domain-containing protein [bacterium]|nr:GIDE domain-containing protein [bacterium]
MLPSDQNATDQPKTNADGLLPPLPPREIPASSGMSFKKSLSQILPIVLYAVQVFLVLDADRGDMLWHFGSWYLFPAALFAYCYWRASVKFHAWQDIPPTKIGELAPGMVKVEGRARLLHDLVIPGTDTKAVLYLSKKYRHSDKHKRLVAATDSADNPFLLVDDTGSVMVDPREATIDYTKLVEVEGVPERRKIIVYSVSYIPEDQPLTVVGFARPLTDDQGNETPGRLVIGQSPSGNLPHTITDGSAVQGIYSRLYLALIVHVGLTLLTLVPLYIHYRVWQCF